MEDEINRHLAKILFINWWAPEPVLIIFSRGLMEDQLSLSNSPAIGRRHHCDFRQMRVRHHLPSYPHSFKLRCCTIFNYLFRNRLSGLFHNKIHLLWNRPESLFLTMVQDVSLNRDVVPFSMPKISCCAFKLCVEGGLSWQPHKSESLFDHAI